MMAMQFHIKWGPENQKLKKEEQIKETQQEIHSTKTLFCDIRERRYEQNNMWYQMSRIATLGSILDS